MDKNSAIDHLADILGIEPQYWDIWGNKFTTSQETKQSLLEAMGIGISQGQDLGDVVDDVRGRLHGQCLEPVQVVSEGECPTILVRVPDELPVNKLTWKLSLEDGSAREGYWELTSAPRQEYEIGRFGKVKQYSLSLGVDRPLPLGYHQLEVFGLERSSISVPQFQPSLDTLTSLIICTPKRAFFPTNLVGGRYWGIGTQLYSVRSDSNMGMGDLGDAKALVGLASDLGADFIGLNPLHALAVGESSMSPYSPVSRIATHFLYLDLKAVPEFAGCDQAREKLEEVDLILGELQNSDLVNYDRVAILKLEILRLLFGEFQIKHLQMETREAQDFRSFLHVRGESLRRYAVYQALRDHFRSRNNSLWGWPVWPEPYKNPDSPEVLAFEQEHQEDVHFYLYMEWLCNKQLSALSDEAQERALRFGLYIDLALGSGVNSSEVWGNQGLYALGASTGCPPDEFNLKGQDWGLPPVIPYKLREGRYQPFIEVLRYAMSHAQVVRLDHVMSLMRLYWVPPTMSADKGAYVKYNLSEMLGIVALESQRNNCVVVGEDLGTVPNEVRQGMKERGILSYKVFIFMKDGHGGFIPPENYETNALVVATTHDLPTLRGFWAEHDIDIKQELSLFPRPGMFDDYRKERANDKERMNDLFACAGINGSESLSGEGAINQADSFVSHTECLLASTPCVLQLVQLEDLLRELRQPNLPGTVGVYPNWQIKLSRTIEELSGDKFVKSLARLVSERRRAVQ